MASETKFKETEIGMIPEEWYNTTLGSLVTFQRGHDLTFENKVEGPYPIVSSSGILGYHNEYKIKGPGVTVGRSGNSLGKAFFVSENYWPHNTILYVKEFHNVFPKFLYYLLKNLNLKEYNSGSAVPTLNRNYIHPIPVVVPKKLEEQKAISRVLSDLDDKIYLNHQMNSTLEQIAQTLFKHWFIDFEFPDENGNPYKSSGGRMVDSELGEIPEGWEVKKLSDICSKVIDGTHDSPKPVEEGYYLVTGKHLSNGFIDFSQCYKISAEDHKKVISRSKPEKGDILFSNIGTLGSTVLVDQNFEFSIKNIALFKPLENFYSRYLYLHFSSTQTQMLLIQKATGTTQTFFSLKFLRDLELLVPPKHIVSKFDETIQPIFEMRSLANQANQSLSQIRDSLLPKLMSGKIRVEC